MLFPLQSEYFSDLAVAPIISGARCMEGMDERGGRALDVSIHCTVHGVDRVRGTRRYDDADMHLHT